MKALVVCWLGGAACGSVSGGGSPDAAADAPTGLVTRSLRIDQVAIGATVEVTPLDVTARAARYHVEEAPGAVTVVDATAEPAGWTAAVPAGPATLAFDLDDYPAPIRRLWGYAAPAIVDLWAVLGRRQYTAAPADAQLDVDSFNNAGFLPGDTSRLSVIGPWVLGDYPAGVPVGGTWDPPSLRFADMLSTTGRHDLVTTADAAQVLRYRGNRLQAWLPLAPVEMGAGTTRLEPLGALRELPPTDAVDVTADFDTALDRFDAVPGGYPDDVAATNARWDIIASPAAAYGIAIGVTLNANAEAARGLPIQGPFSNPFVEAPRDWPALLMVTVSRWRDAAGLPGALRRYAASYTIDSVRSDGAAVPFATSVPRAMRVGGQVLGTDAQQVSLDLTAPVEVSVEYDGSSCDVYKVALDDFVAHPTLPAILERRILASAESDVSRHLVPAGVFEAGKTYGLRTICVLGAFPGVASGDLQARSMPQTITFVDSPTFSVVAR